MTKQSKFSSLLRDWRERMGLSQPQAAVWLSEALGVPVSFRGYQSWEEGQRTPEPYKLKGILEKIGKEEAK